MTRQETEAAIREKIIKAEAALEQIEALATDEFLADMQPDDRAIGLAALKRARKAVAVLHAVAGDVSAYFGGSK